MQEKTLKTAVLGLGNMGKMLLEAAQTLDFLNITAVADSDSTLAQQFANSYQCPFYDDYRQLIMQNQLDCLLVAAPVHTCVEYLKMALKKKFNILAVPPFARNFGEATELVKLADAENVRLAVANLDRFSLSALAIRNFILQDQPGQVFFVLAAGSCPPEQSKAKWRNDPVLAGGGAILYDCWEIIDQICWNFGIPQQVYCAAASTTPDRQQRLYVTEDSAIVTMKFSDTLIASLLAGRAAAVPGEIAQKWLIAHTQDALARFDDKRFELTDTKGQSIQCDEFDDDRLTRLKKALQNFGSNLLWPDTNPLVSTASDNLKNMAVIEAAYLSARTGMPEEPARILKIA